MEVEAQTQKEIGSLIESRFDQQVSSGAEKAIEQIKKDEPFAVIVCDISMLGTDALAFLREVHHAAPDSVCLVLTDFADVDAAAKAANEGYVFRFLTKPCSIETLYDVLCESLDYHRRMLSMSSYTYSARLDKGEVVWTDRSKGCRAVTGYNGSDFEGDCTLWLKIVLPQYRSMLRETIERVIKGEEAGPIEYQLQRCDGEVRWVRESIIPHRDKNNCITYFDGLVEDIHEQKEMERALRESEARYQRMVANVPGLVYQMALRTDGSIEFLFLSESCNEFFGLTPEQIKADAEVLFERFYPEDRAEFYRLIAKSAEKLCPWEWLGRGAFEGQCKWFQAVSRPVCHESGDIVWDGVLLDVTEYKRIENQVKSLAKFPGENPNPVMRISSDGVIIYANRASEPVLNAWGRGLGQSVPGNIYDIISRAREQKAYQKIEIECAEQIFVVIATYIPDADYVNFYCNDITETKRAENELRQKNEVLKEHDRLKSEFVSTVSHELRTPLCIFKNIVSNAMAGVMGKLSHRLYESLRMADQSVDRLSRIVGDFLDISKIESGQMKLKPAVIPVQEIIQEVVDTLEVLASAKKMELKCRLGKGNILVNVDRDRIGQVLTNLIGNAVKFIQTGGRIEVTAEEVGSEVEVRVIDDGPGLSPDKLEKVFDRFVQMHQMAGPGEHGTGLGLTIAKELVQMHGGRMWAESQEGKGCRFCFTLPKHTG